MRCQPAAWLAGLGRGSLPSTMITSPAPISSPPALVLHSIEPPDGPIEAPHSHPGLETVLHVVEGVVYLVLDDDERVLTPGDEAIVGPGRLHRRWNAGDEPAHIVEIHRPAPWAGRAPAVASRLAA